MTQRAVARKSYRIAVSAFVGFVLAFQAVISFGPIVGVNLGTGYWPLLNYAMYSQSFQEGDFIDYYRLLEGVTETGEVVPIPMESLNLHLWHYRALVGDLERGRPEAFAVIFESLPEGVQLREIRVKSFPVAVTRDGPVDQDSILLATIAVPGGTAEEGQ